VQEDKHVAEIMHLTSRAAGDRADDKALAELGESRPASVTVTAVNRFAADELISASREAEMLVVGARRRAPPQRVMS
jgi:hypothetical protein